MTAMTSERRPPPTDHRAVVIGVGRIGAVTAIGLAHLGLDVTGVDRSEARVAALATGRLSEHEPGLGSALTAALRFRALRFVTEAHPGPYDLAFLCVDTPSLPTGEPDLRQLFDAAAEAALLLADGGVLVTRSTVPVGTGDRLAAALRCAGRPDIEVVHLPEFLREGHAWEEFREPDRIVIGGESAVAVARVQAIVGGLARPVVVTDRRTAELAKYAANAYLATSVSFANEMADLCDATGADAASVFGILRADRRIGPHAYLSPGLGFGGHCLPKDVAALEEIAAVHGVSSTLLQAARQVNRHRPPRIVAWLREVLGGLHDARICLAGLSFKAGTDDLRESPSLRLARALTLEGADVTGWDPNVHGPVEHVHVCDSLDEAAQGADALVIAHAWPGWRDLRPEMLRVRMRRPVVVDAPGVLDLSGWCEVGFITRPRHRHPLVPTAVVSRGVA